MAKVLIDKTVNVGYQKQLKNLIFADEKGKVLRILFKKKELGFLYNKILTNRNIDNGNLNDVENILYDAFKKVERESKKLEAENVVDEFIEKLLSLEFVVISSPNDEDAYELFEGLNSTGLSLSAVELTKNAILGRIKLLGSNRMEEAVSIWDDIENIFSSRYIWFNTFLRHDWFSREGYISKGQLFRGIKKNIIEKASIDELFEYLNELKKYSQMYVTIRTSNVVKSDFSSSMQDTAWLRIIKTIPVIKELELEQIYSVLLSLYKYGISEKDYFKRDKFQKHIDLIWKFSFIVKFIKISPSSFEKKFANFCNNIQDKNYNDFKKESNKFFEDLSFLLEDQKDMFSNSIRDKINYQKSDRGFVRFILDEYLISEGGGRCVDPIEAEHIIPDGDLFYWTHIKDKNKVEKYKNHIGNLTLLNDKLNEKIKNMDFGNKNKHGYLKSGFRKNNKLNDIWGEKYKSEDPVESAILPRGKEIGETLYEKYCLDLKNNK